MKAVDTAATKLIGRDRELQALVDRIDSAKDEIGGAVLVRGGAGVGKSSLLEAAKAHALASGFRVLATTGIESESRLPFAGLHQLLRPVLHEIDRLPPSYASAVRAAFGFSEHAASGPQLVALSVLHLLSECADSAPLLLVVDDAHWLDISTSDALAFVSRRLESDPIVMVTALRDGFESPFLKVRVSELSVSGLSERDSETLLAERAPALARNDRERVLAEAVGNPLALVELSTAISASEWSSSRRTTWLPITHRLELAFADRLTSLTSTTRRLLHVAAADSDGVLSEVLPATSRLVGRDVTLESVTEAETARLIETDGTHVRFRHPLMRSAILQAMTLDQRREAHEALAAVLKSDTDRSMWHRAAAVVGTSETVASELEAAAHRASGRGAVGAGFEAFVKAAQLSGNPERRAGRLIEAAQLAIPLGRADIVARLLDELETMELGPLDRPRVVFLREVSQGSYSGSSWVAPYADVADRMRADGDVDRGMSVLSHIGLRCWWSNPDSRTRAHVVEVAERFPIAEDAPSLLHILAMAAPLERGAVVIKRMSGRWYRATREIGENQRLGMTAWALGDFVFAERVLDEFVAGCRTRGILGAVATALTSLAWAKIQRGDWQRAISASSEGSRLAEETGQQTWPAFAGLATAIVLAYRGKAADAEALATESETALLRRGPNPMLSVVQYARGAAALADGRHEEAFRYLRRIFDPADSAHHLYVRNWALVDLAEAAVLSGHERDVHAWLGELETCSVKSGSPLLVAALAFARPILSPEDNEAAFKASLSGRLADWPFTEARLQLAYGLWLRRQRRIAEARTPLRHARDAFDALGATPWGERARQELRASGEESRRRTYDLIDVLSPQELQIAQLAASGLSNKEIGQQLFLSHRTIGSHLYRIFPKLGITARSHLREALEGSARQDGG